jgi:Fe-S cluster assembly protein SufD
MSEDQYIKLFEEEGEALRSGSCEVMNSRRDAAMADFKRLRFPTRKVERYRYTDVGAAFAPNFGLNLRRLNFNVDPYRAYRCSIPHMGTALYYMVNDIFYASPQALRSPLNDVYVGSLRAYSLAHPDFVERYYGQTAQTSDDAVTALNTALAQDGLLIYVPAGRKVEETLQVVNLMCGSVDLMTCCRVLIVVGDGAEVNLLSCEHSMEQSLFLTSCVSEVYVGKDARLSIYSVEETADRNTFFDNLYIRQEAGSRLEYLTLTLRGGLTRRRADVVLAAPGAETRLMGAVVASGKEKVDNNLLIDHRAGECRSDVLFKYVLDEEATGAFAGKVLVREGAQKTESQETNANMCVSPEARMYTQPMLEIYADDVKCNHGSTVGRMDDDALFYMAQRGISPDEARLLLQHAFVNEVISRIRLEPLRDRLSQMVDQRFRFGRKACGDCTLCADKRK